MIKLASEGIETFESIKFNYQELVINEDMLTEESLMNDGLSFLNYHGELGNIVASLSYYYQGNTMFVFSYVTAKDFRNLGLMKALFLELEKVIVKYTDVRVISLVIEDIYLNYFKDIDYFVSNRKQNMLTITKYLFNIEDDDDE